MNRSVVITVALLAAAVAAVAYVVSHQPPAVEVPATKPATTKAALPASTSAPATAPATTQYSDLLAAVDPRYRHAQPLAEPIPIDSGAALTLTDPVYLDFRGDLWITRPDAPPIRDILSRAGKEQVHVTRDVVVWARWVRDDKGNWVAQPVTRGGNRFTWHAQDRAIPLERSDYRFDALVLLGDDRVVVPTTEGAVVIRPPEVHQPPGRVPSTRAVPPSELTETFTAIAGSTPVCAFSSPDGAVTLAYRPWDNGGLGSEAIFRFKDGAWAPLPSDAYPHQPIHTFFMTDGAIQYLSLGEDGGMNVTVEPPLEATPINVSLVEKLVEQLNDPSEVVRDAAEDAIARFGPSAWPVLERVRDAQTPEGQKVVDHLLGARAKRSLGIFTLLPGPIRLLARTPAGAIALLSSGGVNFLEGDDEQLRSPALIIDRPGRPVFLAHPSTIEKRDPDKLALAMLNDDLLVADPLEGLLRHMGNHYEPMLRPKYRDFTVWYGQDREHRWLFGDSAHRRFLLLDPNYSDPAPRLPAWKLEYADGATGYDDADHPAVQRVDQIGERRSLWQLDQFGWKPMDGTTNHLHTDARRGSPTVRLPDGGSVAVDFSNLVTVAAGSTRPATQPLPAEAFSVSPPTLIYAADHLFLFNTPGRISRFTRDDRGQWALDATFTTDVPNSDIRRIWLDPFGRICVAHGDNKLTLFFPDGVIPPDLADLIHPSR